jgi:hypothetical protein
MGTSTDAILFYGYCWDEEVQHPWKTDEADEADEADEDNDFWETRYARAKGCLPPSTPFPERTVTPTRENGWNSTPKDYSAAEQVIIDRYSAYWEAKEKIADASPCVVGTHCSGECPMPYVAVKASLTISHRGCPSKITSLTIEPNWGDQLAEFCKILGVKTKNKKAAWWLVSDWN